MNKEFREELLEMMGEIQTVDCHSHTCLKRDYYKSGTRNLFNLMSYYEREINSATGKGSGDLYSNAKSDAERWECLKPVVKRTRNVSYWRHNVVVYQKLFDMEGDDVTDSNWEKLNENIKSKTADPNWYHHVTKDICKISTQVRNIPWFEDWEPEYFTGVLRMESALQLHDKNTREALGKYLNRSFDNLKVLKQGLADLVEEYKNKGSVGIKLAHAYGRTLASENVSEYDASNIYTKALVGLQLAHGDIK
ncbi:hypothetical protein FJZ33_04115, partial [Candidatus Poribacteria bacterium]|nr:hypothetical protein [Candidatus Poribacteria bacterium]